jgi:hypothetical protein
MAAKLARILLLISEDIVFLNLFEIIALTVFINALLNGRVRTAFTLILFIMLCPEYRDGCVHDTVHNTSLPIKFRPSLRNFSR